MSTTLPHPGRRCATDAGLETELVFVDQHELPEFAAYPLVRTGSGRERLRRYYDTFLSIGHEHHVGVVLETPTWRASADWGQRLGDDAEALDAVNRAAVEFMRDLAASRPDVPTVVSGMIGPRSDGYAPTLIMTVDEAADYHRPQVRSFSAVDADLAGALTMGYAAEAIGIVQAASELQLPITVGFTVETDGRLPSGQPLGDAIAEVDEATDSAAAYFGVNCAHPSHFAQVLDQPRGAWINRIGLIRPNASALSHAELDESTELDDGDPADLAKQVLALSATLPNLAVIGGCCGTDARHVRAMWAAATSED